MAIETVLFSGAYCVSYEEAFESGDEQLGSYRCHFTLSDPEGWTWQAGGPTAYFNPIPTSARVAPPTKTRALPAAHQRSPTRTVPVTAGPALP